MRYDRGQFVPHPQVRPSGTSCGLSWTNSAHGPRRSVNPCPELLESTARHGQAGKTGRIPTGEHSFLTQRRGAGAGGGKVMAKLPHQRTGPKGQPFPQPGPAGRDTHPSHDIRRPKGPTIHLDTRGFLGEQQPESATFFVVTQPGTTRLRQGPVDTPSATRHQHRRLFEHFVAPEAHFAAEQSPGRAGLQAHPPVPGPRARGPGSLSFPQTPASPVL